MQLKMWWNQQPVKPVVLPEGFVVKHFTGDEDSYAWIDITKNGLQENILTKEQFETAMLGCEGLRPENIFFIAKGEESVATVSAVIQKDHTGVVHMVACRPEYRGLGLGSQLLNIALQCIVDCGCHEAFLTTDDFRIPAIKSYLHGGFLPVLYADDMQERWSKILKLIHLEQTDAVDEKGNHCRVLSAAE